MYVYRQDSKQNELTNEKKKMKLENEFSGFIYMPKKSCYPESDYTKSIEIYLYKGYS